MKVRCKVRICKQAAGEHAASCRQFAHVFHKPNTICVAPAFYDLPAPFRYGILLHELGHLAYGAEEKHSEHDADRIAYIISGIQVFRRRHEVARNLETVQPADVNEAKKFLKGVLD